MSFHAPSDRRIVVYSDLDGTFLDHRTYSFAESLPALRRLVGKGVPVVFCSSKTQAEIETLWEKLPGKSPFIAENGAAVVVPKGFFPFPIHETRVRDRFRIIELGEPYEQVIARFRRLKGQFPGTLKGFSDMTDEEVALDTGLSIDGARRARNRQYSEVFKITDGNPAAERLVVDKIKEFGYRCSKGGRYYHLHGRSDKGLAVRALNRLFEKAHGPITTVGIGDSLNDLPMLAAADRPVLVRKPGGRHDREVMDLLPGVRPVDGIGPKGWALIAEEIAVGLRPCRLRGS